MLVDTPRDRHSRLRLRTELEISGLNEIFAAIKVRGVNSTGETFEELVEAHADREILSLASDELRAPSEASTSSNTKSVRYLLNRKMQDNSAGKCLSHPTRNFIPHRPLIAQQKARIPRLRE